MTLHRRVKKPAVSRKDQKRSNVTNIFRLVLGFWFLTVISFRENLPSFFTESVPSFDVSQDHLNFNQSEIKAGDATAFSAEFFEDIDRKAIALNYTGFSIQELAKLLSSLAETEAEKARVIYTWMANNIAYDLEMLDNLYLADVRPITALSRRQTICSGYSNLYQALAEAMGLDAVVIEGTATGTDYIVGEGTINHAWNGVKIDGKWYLLDVTWGAGFVNDNQFHYKFNPYYFATPPEQFIFDHFPAHSVWQLLEQPYTREEFTDLPLVSPNFFENNIDFISHSQKQIQLDVPTDITLSVPKNIAVFAMLQKGDQVLPNHYTLVQRQEEIVQIKTAFPKGGEYQLNLFASSENFGEYKPILTYNLQANHINHSFPDTYIYFQENGGYLYSPLTHELPKKQSIEFKLKIENAIDVQVLNVETNQWTQLTRYDNVFMGKVKVGYQKTQVVAKFPGDSRYWVLLEYN